MNGDARTVILQRIGAALGPTAEDEVIEREWQGIERGYRRTGGLAREAVLALFEDRLRDYDAGVSVCGAGDVGVEIGRVLAARGKRRMAIARGTPAAWRVDGVSFFEDEGGLVAGIDACDGVLTGAVGGIAETGTIVLQNQQFGGQGRRALTLLPDYHLCVVAAADVVETVPEAMALLGPRAGLATTFFSGPSATADIEMTRIKGVHGPRFVDVIVVG